MADSINYGNLMHAALRQLIVEVLQQVSENGLPGSHHFFITFDTRHPGVELSHSLHDRYPEEMTIVIQDWYENLVISGDHFSITLNFGNSPEMLVIPFEAIRTFVDPSVEFGLRFDAQDEDEGEEEDGAEAEEAAATPRGDAEVVSLDQFRKH